MHESVLEKSNIKLIDNGLNNSAQGQAPVPTTIISANVGELRRTDVKQISLGGTVRGVGVGDEENPLECTEKDG